MGAMNRLSNPFRDKTRRPLSAEEARILLRLLAGETLVCARTRAIDDVQSCPVRWYWATALDVQCDWPVIRLLARQAIRPVLVAGGFTEMVLTPAGRAKVKGLKK